MSERISNPILRGFNPDPSIVRVEDEYFIATSTFEWWPCVRIHRSADLVGWETAGHALTDPALIDLRGIPDSGGVWAPSLSWSEGRFWLVYSIVRTMDGDAKDVTNYVVTSASPTGPWSEPIAITSRGFDVSLFHEDGRHFSVGLKWDPRANRGSFAGIVVQEFDPVHGSVGPERIVFQRDELVEGPNLYRRGQWYYLLLAQGGTGWQHGVSIARARDVFGPYEADPQFSVMTSRDVPGNPLQKAGHGELVETADGAWYLVHLASRPVLHDGSLYCITGRETSLQRVAWTTDGWLRLADDDGAPLGGNTSPRSPMSVLPVVPRGSPRTRDDFDEDDIDTTWWSTLRLPAERVGISRRADGPGLVIRGAQSPQSVFEQAMLATRITENAMRATLRLDARPERVGERAGLVAWYDRHDYFYLFVTVDDDGRRVLELETAEDSPPMRLSTSAAVGDGPMELRCELDGQRLQFSWRHDSAAWQPIGPVLRSVVLSDDFGDRLRFTGAFFGIRADDHDQSGFEALAEWFELVAMPQ